MLEAFLDGPVLETNAGLITKSKSKTRRSNSSRRGEHRWG